MNLLTKIFPSSKSKHHTHRQDEIKIYLDSQCKRSIQINPQTVQSYLKQSQFEPDQFLYLIIKHKKTHQIVLKRKLNLFQQLSEAIGSVSAMGSIQKQKEKADYGEYRGYIVMGYKTERNMVPRISWIGGLNQNIKFIRSGTLQKYSDIKTIFEECQLKLHHDYLTFYELKSKQKKVSFLPLQNASVQMVSEKKHIFTVKDKFKSIMFKTSSKEDMIGWLIAINEAIRVRNAQIYMNQLDEKLSRKIKDKLTAYQNRCNTIRSSSRTILLDEMGRKALREYFKKNKQSQNMVDIKLLTIIETYLYMCKVRRQKGEAQSEPIIQSIKQILEQVRECLPNNFHEKDFESKQNMVKAIEEIMKYLDDKYKKVLLEKKILHQAFQTYLVQQYKQKSAIQVQSLFGEEIKK